MYKFRELKATDIFLMLNLIKKIGLKNFNVAINASIEEKDGNTYAKLGMAMFEVIIDRLSIVEDDIYALLSATSDLSVEQIKDLDMVTFINMIKDFIQLPQFAELFTQAQSLLK